MTRRSLEDLIGQAPRKRGRPVEDHRQKLVLEQTEEKRLKNAKMRGELVPVADVAAEWSGMIADARQRLLAVPSRVGAKLALPRASVALIDAEIRAALQALASQGGGGHADDA